MNFLAFHLLYTHVTTSTIMINDISILTKCFIMPSLHNHFFWYLWTQAILVLISNTIHKFCKSLTSHKWNQTICTFLCKTYFLSNVCEIHSCCCMHQFCVFNAKNKAYKNFIVWIYYNMFIHSPCNVHCIVSCLGWLPIKLLWTLMYKSLWTGRFYFS